MLRLPIIYLKQFTNWIDNIGMISTAPEKEKRKTKILNRIGSTCVAAVVLLIPVSLFKNAYEEAIAQFVGLLLSVNGLWVNSLRRPYIARSITLIAFVGYLTGMTVLWGVSRGSWLIIFNVAVVCIFFFESRRSIYIHYFIAIVGLIICGLSSFHITPLYTSSNTELAYLASVFITVILLFVQTMTFKDESLKYQHQVEESLAVITSKQRRINSSISYAKLIQDAILPSQRQLDNTVFDNFILYRPLDVVSGDFYFFHREKERVFIIVGDCTGHGVPGAFMTMIGITLLNDIIKRQKVIAVRSILNKVDEGIYEGLKQAQNKNTDGMDMGLCVIDERANTLTFSGARISLWIVRNGLVEEIKAARTSLGGAKRHKIDNYKIDTFPLETVQGFYITSDGFQDQIGNNGRRFTRKRLKTLLDSIINFDVQSQRETASDVLDRWKGKQNQLDDIVMVGVARRK